MTQLLDQFGRAIAPLKRPETREIAAVSIRDRWSGYPSAGLTPARLAAIFREADWGSLRNQAELFEEMEEKDPHLFSVMQTRRLAVLGLDWQVEDASESSEDQKIAEFCREQMETLDLDTLWTHLMGAVGHGYAAAELLWEASAQAVIKGFRSIHPKNITFVDSLIPLVVTDDNWQGVATPPWKLAYHRYAAKSGHDTRNGVLRICAYMYLFKNYALKDWATFNELFGMPLRLGKYEPSATPADREALRAAIMALGTDAAGIISKSTEIDFVEATSRLSGTFNPYQVMTSFCNREMSKAVLGQTLTTDTEGSTGTYAAGRVQAEVRQDLLEADAKALARTVPLQILKPLVGFNFGWDKALPGFAFQLAEELDLKADSEVCKNLAGIGFRIPVSYISEHFGIPLAEEGEETLSPPAAASAVPPPPADNSNSGGSPSAALKAGATLPLRRGELELIPQDHEVIRTQTDLEKLTQAAVDASSAALAKMLRPIDGLIDQGASLEALRDGLLAVYPEMDAGDLGELIYQARMLAYMRGRVEHG
jgi:phage gp29-like protein